MNFSDEPLVFDVGGESLLGILSRPADAADCGVVVVVGGPQYRVGSHRQFLLLARRLAAAGYPTLRFDVRGMGDSDGAMRSFEDLSADVGAAVDALTAACPGLRRVVLWGLCDAASAALLYVDEVADARIAGLVLLNPWVRSEASLARTHIKHYYAQRLLEPQFWRKLFSGRLAVAAALRGLLSSARSARAPGAADGRAGRPYQARMAQGLRAFRGAVLLVLSGEDYTAKEFIDFAGGSADWSGLLDAGRVRRVDFAAADHTFSSAAARARVEDETLAWLGGLPPAA